MKRRALIIQGVTAAFSAWVFTASGWLMGTRALTMPTPGPDLPTPMPGWDVGQEYAPCAAPEDCNVDCQAVFAQCVKISTCQTENKCVQYFFHYKHCYYLPCANGWCQIYSTDWGCASCNCP
jgi:hypothetical protein